MEPNIRFLLSSRIPSIRAAERAAPLKIKYLVVGGHQIIVNTTRYEYGIYQVDREDGVPRLLSGTSELNERWTCDVDEFGIRDYITNGMLPGNNGLDERNLFGERDFENIPTNEGRLEKLKETLEIEKQTYNQLLGPQTHPIGKFPTTHNEMVQFYRDEVFWSLDDEEMSNEDIEKAERKIELMENELLPFENKRNNIRPKFEIHLFKSQFNSQPQVIERIKYTGDLHEAEESILNFMFSKREIDAYRFSIYDHCPVIVMPRDLKLRISSLALSPKVSVKGVKSVVDASSFPLEEMSIFVNEERDELDYEFVRTAKLLDIYGKADQLLPFLLNFQNQNVFVRFKSNVFLSNDDFVVLIRSWVETDKPIGTLFTFEYRYEKDIIRTLNFIRNQIDSAVAVNNCVHIPMRNFKLLKISYNDRKETELAIMPSVLA
uniref:FTH domain-containing protein n=1 Tax=Caenorhabditis tropicalis TaxID=1561998 RepID=A0A1I7UDS8_9PELO